METLQGTGTLGCEGCINDWNVKSGVYACCMDCTRARQKGFMSKKCSCPKRFKTVTVKSAGRAREVCERCLQVRTQKPKK